LWFYIVEAAVNLQNENGQARINKGLNIKWRLIFGPPEGIFQRPTAVLSYGL
jgi:hypothetical protein